MNVANAYDIAIKISCENSVSPVLAIIAKDMLGLTGTAKQLEQAFNRIGTGLKLAVGGAAGIMAGIGIEKGLMDIARAGENLLHQQSIMLRNGLSMATVAGLTADAYDRIAKAVPTAPADAILRTESELRSVTGSTDEAVKATPFALKLDALVENVTGKVSEGAGFAIWRALEMKGITASNPDLTSKLAETMARIIGASSGKVTADSYNQFAKRGGIAWINASPEFIAGAGSNLVGDFGGDTGGTALATFYNTMSGAAQLTRQQVDVLEKSGMLDPTKVHKVKGSNAMQMDPGAIKGWLQYEHDPDQFVQQVLAPALHALADKDSATGMGKADDIYDNLIGKLGRNKNTQRLMKLWGDPGFRAQIDKDLNIWSGAMGLDPAYATMMGDGQAMGAIDPSQAAHGAKPVIDNAKPPGDYMAVMKAFTAQWNSMMEAVGGPVAQALIPTLKTITDSFTQLGSWANTHSAEVQTMTKVTEALGVAIAALGAVALGAGIATLIGPTGAIIGLSVAIGTMISTFQGNNIAALAQSASKALDGFLNALANFIARIAALLHLPGFSNDDPSQPSRPVTPTPALVPHAIPANLEAKRKQFEALNPTGVLKPYADGYDPLKSIHSPVKAPSYDPLKSILPPSGVLPVSIVKPPHELAAMSSRVFEGRDPRSPQLGPLAYIPPPPQPAPIVNVTNNVSPPVTNVVVNVDGALVTAAVSKTLERESRVSTGVNMHDGAESYRSPDQGGIRHQ